MSSDAQPTSQPTRAPAGPQAIYTIEWLADEEAALELAREEVQRAYRFECDDGEVPW